MLFTKAGVKYKEVIFKYMKKLIQKEEIPKRFTNTFLTPTWKKKGTTLDLKNIWFILEKQIIGMFSNTEN